MMPPESLKLRVLEAVRQRPTPPRKDALPLTLGLVDVSPTIADLVGEVHDTHHPLGAHLYYEQQKPEALRRSRHFRNDRIKKYLAWFERIIANNREGGTHLAGNRLSYADLSLFQVVEGLLYAFPKSTGAVLDDCPRVAALREMVAQRPRIRAYLAYVNAGKYQVRYQTRSLRILTVTTTPERLENLRKTTLKAGGGDLFWFTTLDQVSDTTILSSPIWRLANDERASARKTLIS